MKDQEKIQKMMRMFWDLGDAYKAQLGQNITTAARQNDLKVTNDDLQRILHVVNSSIEQVSLQSSSSIEDQIKMIMNDPVSVEEKGRPKRSAKE